VLAPVWSDHILCLGEGAAPHVARAARGSGRVEDVRVAVLVFLNPTATPPAEVTELAQSGADYALFAGPISVQPQ
jgi:hypothetical protein